MATRTIGLALMLALLGVIGSAMPGHAMGICVGSRAMDIQQDACVKRATAVMRRHFKDVQPDCALIFAFGGGNLAAAIVCDQADKGVVFFSSSSTNAKLCHTTYDQITGGF